MKKIIRFFPLILFLLLAVFLYRGLYLNPRDLPSVLLNQPAPKLNLSEIDGGETFSLKSMNGKVWLLNVWATWCVACREEHPVMMDIAREHIPIIGMAYKDKATKAKAWLNQYGSPYQSVLVDESGEHAIDWGVYGAPETFMLDKHGIIRYKHLGVVTHTVWEKTLKPIYLKLKEAA